MEGVRNSIKNRKGKTLHSPVVPEGAAREGIEEDAANKRGTDKGRAQGATAGMDHNNRGGQDLVDGHQEAESGEATVDPSPVVLSKLVFLVNKQTPRQNTKTKKSKLFVLLNKQF